MKISNTHHQTRTGQIKKNPSKKMGFEEWLIKKAPRYIQESPEGQEQIDKYDEYLEK